MNIRDIKTGTLIRDIDGNRWFKPRMVEDEPPILINLANHKIRFNAPKPAPVQKEL